MSEILCEPEELLCMLRWLHLLKFNKQIEITFFWIEPVIGRLSEYSETPDLPVSAYPDNLL
jgi:hypothetical protein